MKKILCKIAFTLHMYRLARWISPSVYWHLYGEKTAKRLLGALYGAAAMAAGVADKIGELDGMLENEMESDGEDNAD